MPAMPHTLTSPPRTRRASRHARQQLDRLPAALERAVGRLQHPHHAQPALAVAARRLAALDAGDEVETLLAEWLAHPHARNHHVARTHLELELAEVVDRGGASLHPHHALVVDLDLGIGADVV